MNEYSCMCESFINWIHLIKSFRLLEVFSFIPSLTLASTLTISQNGIDDAKVLKSAILNWLSSIFFPSFTKLKYRKFWKLRRSFSSSSNTYISQNQFIYSEFIAVTRYHIKLILLIIGPDLVKILEMNVSNETNFQQSLPKKLGTKSKPSERMFLIKKRRRF